jgi:hypothetical protein
MYGAAQNMVATLFQPLMSETDRQGLYSPVDQLYFRDGG